jgi:hypothetical protein
MRIIQEIKGAIGWVVEWALLTALFVLAAATAPVVELLLPQLLIAHNSRNLDQLKTLFLLANPLFVMLWMGILCHYHSLRLWKTEDRDMGPHASNWREAQGGWLCTLSKSFGFMALGLFGTLVCDKLFMIAFRLYVPHSIHGAVRQSLWFALLPLAAFAPVILLLIKRWNYTERTVEHRSDSESNPELERLEAELIAEGRARRDKQMLNSMGISDIS